MNMESVEKEVEEVRFEIIGYLNEAKLTGEYIDSVKRRHDYI